MEAICLLPQHLRDFSRIIDTKETVEDIVDAMLRYARPRQPRVVWHCAREAIKKREQS